MRAALIAALALAGCAHGPPKGTACRYEDVGTWTRVECCRDALCSSMAVGAVERRDVRILLSTAVATPHGTLRGE